MQQKKQALFTFSLKGFGQARPLRCSDPRRENSPSPIPEERSAADGVSQLAETLTGEVNKAKKHRWIAAFTGCIVLLFFIGCSNNNKIATVRSLPVTIGEAVVSNAPVYVESIGNVYSLQTVQIRPQVGGIILEAYVKQGQYVKKGDPLYLIDPRPYQANLELAKGALLKDSATLKFDKLRVMRYAELTKEDYFAKINYEQFLTNVEADEGQILTDKANIALAEINLGWCTPRSPIDGKISQYNIDPGNLVVVDDVNALTDIRQITPADIRFNITQKEFVAVQQAVKDGVLKFEVILPQDIEHPREGHIYFIDNHLDLTTGTILLRGTVPNEDEFLWPGEFIQVRLLIKILQNALLVPEEAIGNSEDGPFVFIYDPETSTVKYRSVTKGEKINNMIVVEKGVQAGDKVVTKGQINLRNGSKVYLANNAPSEKRTR